MKLNDSTRKTREDIFISPVGTAAHSGGRDFRRWHLAFRRGIQPDVAYFRHQFFHVIRANNVSAITIWRCLCGHPLCTAAGPNSASPASTGPKKVSVKASCISLNTMAMTICARRKMTIDGLCHVGNVIQQKFLIISTVKRNVRKPEIGFVRFRATSSFCWAEHAHDVTCNGMGLGILHNFFRIGEEGHFQLIFPNANAWATTSKSAVCPISKFKRSQHRQLMAALGKRMLISRFPPTAE